MAGGRAWTAAAICPVVMGMGSSAIAQGLDPDKGTGVGGGGRMVGRGGTQRPSRGRALELGEKLEGAQAGGSMRQGGTDAQRSGRAGGTETAPAQSLAGPSSSPSVPLRSPLCAAPEVLAVFRPPGLPPLPQGHTDPRVPPWPGRGPSLVQSSQRPWSGL